MYLGVDCGGTKTLLAVFSEDGRKLEERRFPTSQDYDQFLKDIKVEFDKLEDRAFKAVCCALTFRIDRDKGIRHQGANLNWPEVPIKSDLQKILGVNQVYLENDAKLAGLYEAKQLGGEQRTILYITLGTGIGVAVISNGQIDQSVDDAGGLVMKVEKDGQQHGWEELSSGRAIVKRYGHKAKDIKDPAIWADYSIDLAKGISQLIDRCRPDIIIIGGGVGSHFDKFGDFLTSELTKKGSSTPIVEAKNPEEAVIYGCYEYIRQQIG